MEKERLKNWLKNKNNLLLILLILFAIFLRFYYFTQTENQPLWWDESEYMAAAKSYAGIGDYHLSDIRSPLYSFTITIFYKLGISNEVFLRFLLLFLPSILLIFLVYKTISEIYTDKRIALISSLILTVLWEHVFYSNRFHTENLALIFQFLAILFFFRSYLKSKDKNKRKFYLGAVSILSIISILYRPGNLPFIPAIILFYLFCNSKKLISNKKILYSLLILGVLSIFLFFSGPIQKISFVNNYYHPESPLGWKSLTVFSGLFGPGNSTLPNVLFYSFILGFVYTLFNLWLKYPKIKNFETDSKELELKADLFNLLLLLSVMFLFVFMLRANVFEYRWFFPFLPAVLVMASKGITQTSDYISSFTKKNNISTWIILLVLLIGLTIQISHTTNLVNLKSTSYKEVKDSGLWIKEHSIPGDSIISASIPQHSYYSERKVYNFGFNEFNKTEEIFNAKIDEFKPKYLIVSVFEQSFTPEWAYSWPEKHKGKVTPVQAYFADPQKTQPILIIYQINYA